MDRYDALIFDCDGTLTDSMPLHYIAWHKVMTRHGVQFPEQRFYQLGGMPTDRIVALLAAEHGLVIDAPKVALEKEEAFLETLSDLRPIEWVVEVARQQRGHKQLAVASGGFRQVITAQLRQIGCIEWFQTIVTAEDTPRHKPEPDVFLEAASRLGVAPARCCVYEDADLGIEAACRAGMDYVDVRQFGKSC
jgi:HAD superfamily hydrolase (TIGR01509 family)